MAKKSKKLLDQVRDVIRRKYYARRTEKSYANWIKRFILFHDKRHPQEMGADEVEAFLTYLAVERNVAAATALPSRRKIRRSAPCSSFTKTCLRKILSVPSMPCFRGQFQRVVQSCARRRFACRLARQLEPLVRRLCMAI